jgi:hypothetical protein
MKLNFAGCIGPTEQITEPLARAPRFGNSLGIAVRFGTAAPVAGSGAGLRQTA